MPAQRVHTSVWVILSVAITVIFGVFSFVWSILQGQITEFKAEVKAEFLRMQTDFSRYQNDARWQYATKDFVNGKIEGIKDEEKAYREGIQREFKK